MMKLTKTNANFQIKCLMIMGSEVQLNLFGNNDPISLLMQEIELLKEQNNNVRKGLFARHNELAKLVLKQQEEIDALKSSMYSEKKPDMMEMLLF